MDFSILTRFWAQKSGKSGHFCEGQNHGNLEMSKTRRDLNPGLLHVEDTLSRCFRRLLTTFQTAADFGPKSGFFDFDPILGPKIGENRAFLRGTESRKYRYVGNEKRSQPGGVTC